MHKMGRGHRGFKGSLPYVFGDSETKPGINQPMVVCVADESTTPNGSEMFVFLLDGTLFSLLVFMETSNEYSLLFGMQTPDFDTRQVGLRGNHKESPTSFGVQIHSTAHFLSSWTLVTFGIWTILVGKKGKCCLIFLACALGKLVLAYARGKLCLAYALGKLFLAYALGK